MFLHKRTENIVKWMRGYALEPIAITPFIVGALLIVTGVFDQAALVGFFSMLTIFSPLWFPAFLAIIFWILWMHYIRYIFWFNQEYVLLEIQLPQEVEKSPLAMETFLTTLWNAGGETTFLHRIWKGQFRIVWSLEIASNEGKIGFYMHVRKGWRNIVEARLYGQFPEAKVQEVDDYVAKVPFNLDEYSIAGGEYRKGAPQALPIKTYKDFGLDKDPKEEYKIDPISNILELLGQIGKDEYFWLQILIKAHKKDEWYGFYLEDKKHHPHYTVEARKAVEEIMAGAAARAQNVLKASEAVDGKMNALLTDVEKKKIEAIELSQSKLLFECGFRAVYIAKKEKFVGVNAGGIVTLFAGFRSMGYTNSLGIHGGTLFFDYPWQDFKHMRLRAIQKEVFFLYKNRAYFYVPYDQRPQFMTTEELATIWHFPGSAVKTPGLTRVVSRRAEAPSNLPISE